MRSYKVIARLKSVYSNLHPYSVEKWKKIKVGLKVKK
jgi:hypothetical protein